MARGHELALSQEVPAIGTLAATNVTKHHGAQLVLSDVSLVVPPGARIGLVGPNGIGKSTLLRILAGLEEADAGRVRRDPPTSTVGYLPQEPDARPGETLRAYLARRAGVADSEHDLARAAEAIADGRGEEDAYAAALERLLALGGEDFEARARAVCTGLGLGGSLEQETATLSGGQSARAALASVLLSRYDTLLLDEPTNNLDFDGLARLERFLEGFDGALIVVSHDRDFLDRTATRIAEIEEDSGRLVEWAGGWSDYEAARETARRAAYARFELTERRRSELESLLVTRQGEAHRAGKQADRRGTHALMTKVRQAERMLERLERADKPFEPWELRMSLGAGRRSGDVVARLEGAVVERGGFRLGPIDVEVGWRERLAVVGPNGSGKTTLLEALLGRLPLTAGRRVVGTGIVLGELEQDRSAFTGERLLPLFVRRSGLPPEASRTLLAKFGLGANDVLRCGSSLSPGERTRATLALLVARGVNCLVLDEPTNHLDVPAIEELEAALDGFDGTVLLVTHDRRFLERFRATRTLELPPTQAPAARDGRPRRAGRPRRPPRATSS